MPITSASIALALTLLAMPVRAQTTADTAVRVGVVGLVHSHVHWILGRASSGDVRIVGIAEPNRELAERFSVRHGFDMSLVYDSVDEMLDAVQPEAVTVFTSIRDHLPVTRAAAKRGIHVMVEKPLAANLADALQMQALADSAGIHLLTNYETSWYPSVHRAREMAERGDLGPIRKMVIRDGHPGPAEIGVDPEFLEWLTDPEENGGGAVIDFGCYGANLATWFMGGRRPLTVTALLQTFKADRYRDVDDEATIVLTYEGAQAIIQASWNWPFNRKDMDVYGATGYVSSDDATTLRFRLEHSAREERLNIGPLPPRFVDPFAYLASVVRGETTTGSDLSSLPVNLVVMEILDAAMRSAASGMTIHLSR